MSVQYGHTTGKEDDACDARRGGQGLKGGIFELMPSGGQISIKGSVKKKSIKPFIA